MRVTVGILMGVTMIVVAQRSWRRLLGWALSRGD